MSATSLHVPVSMGCGGTPRGGCERKRPAPRLRSRIALAALALAALMASAYGERWVLREAPLPAFEYVVATCAALAVSDGPQSSACNAHQDQPQTENHE